MKEQIKEFCQNIKNLILEDKVKQALEELNKLTVLLQSLLLKDEVILLIGKHKKLVREIAAGILTYEQQEVSLNRIRKTVLDFIQALEKEDFTDEELLSTFRQSYQGLNEAIIINQQHSGVGDNVAGNKITHIYTSTGEIDPDSHSNVPHSVTFGKKLLFIPTLEEMGIQLAGLGYNKIAQGLENYSGLWVKRGDPLVTYTFYAFSKEKSNIYERITGNHLTTSKTWSINSPVDGMIISTRREQTSEQNSSTGLVYHNIDRSMLPIILIPNDEPFPDEWNFSTYDGISSWLSNCFNLLFIRSRDDFSPGRLKDYIAKSEYESVVIEYAKQLEQLKKRGSKTFRTYELRDFSKKDGGLAYDIQKIRTKFLDLREKLVHIAREFGEGI